MERSRRDKELGSCLKKYWLAQRRVRDACLQFQIIKISHATNKFLRPFQSVQNYRQNITLIFRKEIIQLSKKKRRTTWVQRCSARSSTAFGLWLEGVALRWKQGFAYRFNQFFHQARE